MTSPDLAADTIAVLAAFAEMVNSTDRYPGKDEFGDERTAECLEHARECVNRAAADVKVPVLTARHADGSETRHAVNTALAGRPQGSAAKLLGAILSMQCDACPEGFRHEVTETGEKTRWRGRVIRQRPDETEEP